MNQPNITLSAKTVRLHCQVRMVEIYKEIEIRLNVEVDKRFNSFWNKHISKKSKETIKSEIVRESPLYNDFKLWSAFKNYDIKCINDLDNLCKISIDDGDGYINISVDDANSLNLK